MRFLVILIAVLALAGCSKPQPQQPANETQASTEAGPVKGVDRSHKGTAAPGAVFDDPDGGEMSLADFKGAPVLVNLWASWCAPCVKELPTLDRLATAHSGARLRVIAVSQDSGPQPSVEAFLAKLKVEELGAYHDPKMGLLGALGPDVVLPTSILYDAQGREVWRYVGDLDWTGPEAARLLSEAGASATG
jgi:thiol-disulfide isomerase/thioredoxin